MKKFILKNKLPLFLLAAVLMLSTFYVLSPLSKDKSDDTTVSTPDTSGYYYFDEERLNIIEERNLAILEIEEQIASNYNSSEIAVMLNEINNINNITSLECSLEREIEALGYIDVLVHNYNLSETIDSSVIKTKCIDIKILTNELTKERAVAITQLAKTKFGNNDYKVALLLESNTLS